MKMQARFVADSLFSCGTEGEGGLAVVAQCAEAVRAARCLVTLLACSLVY